MFPKKLDPIFRLGDGKGDARCFVEGHKRAYLYNQGTKKNVLTKKDYKKIFLDFYYIHYFMITVDSYMAITRMMSC
jgi:hypothetical protein